MSITYRVWIHVEEHHPDCDPDYREVEGTQKGWPCIDLPECVYENTDFHDTMSMIDWIITEIDGQRINEAEQEGANA